MQLEEERRLASRPRHNKLDLINLVEGGGAEEIDTLSAAMQSVSKDVKRNVPDFEDFVYDDDKKEEREVDELRKKLSGMVVHARAKVTKSRIYSAAYHPEVTKDLIFFGGALFYAFQVLCGFYNCLPQTRKEPWASGTRELL